jgi:hypothetical protein
VILVTQRQRFHDETAPEALGTPATAPKARDYYSARYYDAANRLTATVNVGTNVGTAWDRSANPTPPPRADTALVTSYGYQADAVQQVQLTGAPTGGTFTLTFNGQTTAALAYNAAAAAVQSAVQALATIGAGNALVAGGAGGPWQVRFAGALAGTAQPALTGSGAGLTGGSAPAVAVAVTSPGGKSPAGGRRGRRPAGAPSARRARSGGRRARRWPGRTPAGRRRRRRAGRRRRPGRCGRAAPGTRPGVGRGRRPAGGGHPLPGW